MYALRTPDFGELDVFAICQAHAQLESDYNIGGILIERPSNRRRMASTGVQLHRMRYSNIYGWVSICADPEPGDDSMDEDVRVIYVANVLKLGLPMDDDLKKVALRIFTREYIESVRPGLLH